jgi:hypothetical protein
VEAKGSEVVIKSCHKKEDDDGGDLQELPELRHADEPRREGTNADGSRSTMYCSHCFAAGKFTMPDITVDQMQDRVRAKLKEFGVPGPLGWFFTRKVPKLARWAG